jgi:hypothetical protein
MRSYSSMVPVLMLLAAAAPASAQAPAPRDPGAAANVRESEQYTQLLRSSPTFRAQRMQLECGPINDPELLASCVASFQAYGPTPPPRKRGQ